MSGDHPRVNHPELVLDDGRRRIDRPAITALVGKGLVERTVVATRPRVRIISLRFGSASNRSSSLPIRTRRWAGPMTGYWVQ